MNWFVFGLNGSVLERRICCHKYTWGVKVSWRVTLHSAPSNRSRIRGDATEGCPCPLGWLRWKPERKGTEDDKGADFRYKVRVRDAVRGLRHTRVDDGKKTPGSDGLDRRSRKWRWWKKHERGQRESWCHWLRRWSTMKYFTTFYMHKQNKAAWNWINLCFRPRLSLILKTPATSITSFSPTSLTGLKTANP